MQQFNCLDPRLNVRGYHFLEASAGTGKTFTIEHVAIRLLLESDEIDIGQVLIVTFTQAATRELRLRLRHRLDECLEALQEKRVIYPYLEPFITDDQWQKGIKRLKLALRCFEKAQIFTIHGFCHRMLADKGHLLTQQSLEDLSYHKFLHQQICDFLRTGLKPAIFSLSQIDIALKASGGSYEKLCRQIAQHQKQDSTAYLSFDEIWIRMNHVLKNAKADFEKLCVAAKCYKGTCNRSGDLHPEMEEQISILSEAITAAHITKPDLDKLLSFQPSIMLLMHLDNKKLKLKVPVSVDVEDMLALLYPIFEEALDPKRILSHMAMLCAERVEKAKLAFDIHFPDDLLVMMDQALEDDAFSASVRKQFQAVIIDEFQDTDQIQWSIFTNLFVKHEISTFYLVGDPKQSIYAFRNADLNTYLCAADKLGEDKRKFLSTNYRSSPDLIKSLNALFGHEKARGWLKLPSNEKVINFQPSVAGTKEAAKEFDDKKQALHVMFIEDPKARQVPSSDHEEHLLFPYIAKEIQTLNRPFSSYAVLIKDRYQAMRLQKFFKQLNIPSICKSNRSVASSKTYQFLDALIQAILKPTNPSNLKRLLSAPISAWPYFGLVGSQYKSDVMEIIEKLYQWKHLWHQKGFSSVIDNILSCCFGKKQSLVKQLAAQNHGQDYIDFMHLTELLLTKEGEAPLSPHDLYQYLLRLKDIDPDLYPHVKQRESQQEDAVTIMTTHMSKGLEFDVVFALGVASRQARVKAEEKENLEALRLFYVALTRAKTRVYLPLILTPGKKQATVLSPAEQFFSKWGELSFAHLAPLFKACHASSEKLAAPIQISPIGVKKTVTLDAPKQHDIFATPCFVTSYSSLVKPEKTFFSDDLIFDSNTDEKTLHTLPPGAKTGTLWHRILERVFEQEFYQDKTPQRISQLVKRCLPSSMETWIDVLSQSLFQLLSIPIDGFCLRDISQDGFANEMEFLLPVQEDMALKGFADLIFQIQGKTYVIDWKSNWLGPSDEDYKAENLKKAMQQHDYFLQARIYSTAVRKWLCHRPLKATSFGGVFYVFLRGINHRRTHGIYHYRNE